MLSPLEKKLTDVKWFIDSELAKISDSANGFGYKKGVILSPSDFFLNPLYIDLL